MSARNSIIISICILLSRALGLIREVLFAHFLGVSLYADALKAALRIPNVLQNLFGEGVLSACFIPEYAHLKANSKNTEARQLTKECASSLLAVSVILTTLGIIFSDELVSIFAPGFSGETYFITSTLLKITFPAMGLLVLSALCLGVLNSHRRFLLSYSAPLAWNSCIIGALLLLTNGLNTLQITELIAWAIVAGSALQLLVQLPTCVKELRLLSQAAYTGKYPSPAFLRVLTNFIPVVLGRGIVQISSYVDTIFASLLSLGSLSSLMYAQTLYLLPISVFGLANAAATLPELSEKNYSNLSEAQKSEIAFSISQTLLRTASIVIPIALVFIIAPLFPLKVLFLYSSFTEEQFNIIALTLSCLALGIVPSTISRVLSSVLYAANQQKFVMWTSLARLTSSAIIAYALCFILLPNQFENRSFDVIGIGLAASFSSLIEIIMLYIRIKAFLPLSCFKRTTGDRRMIILSFLLGLLIAFALRHLMTLFS